MEQGPKWAVMVLGTTVVLCGGIWGILLENVMNIDDITLFNPIYTYVNYNTMAYPAYGYFDAMFVHPPTHYYVAAILMKTGLPLFYATALPQVLLVLLAVGCTVFSQWSNIVKASVLFGGFAGAFLPWYTFHGSAGFGVRPDLHLALAWFAGLVALETGRLAAWRPWRLGVGSFLLAYASGLHYTGITAWTGVLVYLLWLLGTQGWHDGRKSILAMVLGLGAFGVPYLALFWIPHWGQIMGFINSVGATGGAWTSLQTHLHLYSLFLERTDPFSHVLFSFLSLGIPTLLLSAIILGVFPETRGLALAGLPHLLFLLLVLRRKETNHDYLLPEYMLYVTAVILIVLHGVNRLAGRFSDRLRQAAVAVGVACLAGGLVVGTPWLKEVRWNVQSRPNEMDIARAAGRLMMGSDALVGHRLGRFYTSGAAHSYFVQFDLIRQKLELPEVLSYFSEFDALAEDIHMSDLPLTLQGHSLGSLYAIGELSLRGFYFSGRHNALSYVLLSRRLSRLLEGYATFANGHIVHFEEDPEGDHLFLAAVCEADSPSPVINMVIFHNRFMLPVSEDGTRRVLMTVVVELGKAAHVRGTMEQDCMVREAAVLRQTTVDSRMVLDSLADDRPIKFYQHTEGPDGIFTLRNGPLVDISLGADGWPEGLHFARGTRRGKHYRLTKACELLRTDMQDVADWELRKVTRRAKLEVVPNGLTQGDYAARFMAGKGGDRIATPYILEECKEGELLFFSLWVKSIEGNRLPDVNLEVEQDLIPALPLQVRTDGWVLLGGWTKPIRGNAVRLIMAGGVKRTFLLDKVMIVGVPRPPGSPSQSN